MTDVVETVTPVVLVGRLGSGDLGRRVWLDGMAVKITRIEHSKEHVTVHFRGGPNRQWTSWRWFDAADKLEIVP